MSSSFKTILVPVDLSGNTDLAIRKAVDLAAGKAVVHLLHVLNNSHYRFSTTRSCHTSALRQLQECVSKVKELNTEIKVQAWIENSGSVQESIGNKARELKCDLVVIAKKSMHSFMPFLNTVSPSRLVENTGCPVLTVKQGSLDNPIRAIVMPVNENFPKAKVDALLALCRSSKVRVYLVTFLDHDHIPSRFSATTLLKVYQWLRTSVHCPVEYAVLRGSNKPRAMLQYAMKINADILLVNPRSETRIGWLNSHISDVLPAASKMQVLTVQPGY